MNSKTANLIVGCYNNGLDVGFVAEDKYFVLRHDNDWVLRVGDMNANTAVLSFPVALVEIQKSEIDPENESHLVFDFGGEGSLMIFVEGEE